MQDTQPMRVRFGAFELDLKSGQLFSTSIREPKAELSLRGSHSTCCHDDRARRRNGEQAVTATTPEELHF